ncbi:hypothetical protein NAEGRDRAFT_79530 [Naegleria gruberi]|uniref:HNH domain-containing protein n=1 Tax=Naegleria gruberi TaxID=5762 RepID=D2VD62_NAEGR|nr:uncharacterized protein NAEGRDRAFT_79530 [Naegleria gruberi]EFC45275.1 hypothetical protein NAEGRDRAFT_79530 [Naegleria gruberi]|eukprot:XP_002678019.1 hypothetical protein NAEGRDRAFT_79530 [Naegleria gruberi strain NEG-M]
MSQNEETPLVTFDQLSDEQIETCVKKALMKALPQLIEDEDILEHLLGELLQDNLNVLLQSGAVDETLPTKGENKASNHTLAFSAISNTKGEKKQKSLTLITNILSEHLINYDLALDDEKEVQSICNEIQEHLQNLRLCKYEDYGIVIDSDDDDGAYVEDGCCVMCEREMKLTRHHLIPRWTHRKFLKRGQYSKEHLNKVILICRPCHDAVHTFITLDEMAEKYHSLETIMEHPKVQGWIPYISRVRTTKRFRF